MKKFIIIFLIICLFSMFGCSTAEQPDKNIQDSPPSSEQTEQSENTDKNGNDDVVVEDDMEWSPIIK